jgi:energy-converting hydrogenase A subunit R
LAEKIYITDCEGPVSKNDNAYEISETFLNEGGKLFSLLSKFDDYLGDIEKIQGYKYGSTLKYILPFLKAEGVTDEGVRDFSKTHITIMNGVRETLLGIGQQMKVYMVSTSYVHYIEEIARYMGLNEENLYCTAVSFDAYTMDEEERGQIRAFQEKFLELPNIVWDEMGNIPAPSMYSIEVLKSFFFSRLPKLPVHNWMKDVDPIGGEGKAQAIAHIVSKNGIAVADTVYVGDSITDVNAFALVRENGGLSISFNGNRYAVQNAEYIVVSTDATVLKDMVLGFLEKGKEAITVGNVADSTYVYKNDGRDLGNIVQLSEKMRKEVRGLAIGALG